jgi:hypothetical protein
LDRHAGTRPLNIWGQYAFKYMEFVRAPDSVVGGTGLLAAFVLGTLLLWLGTRPGERQARCEIAKTLVEEGECQRLGEVQLDGSLLCAAHAEMVRLGERSEAMLGEVFKMDEWLESVDGQADELRVWRAEHHRNELVEQLRFNRTRMELIRNELMKD